MTAVKCIKCNSFNAQCDTSMLLTSDPPKYACSCKDCGYTWYIFTYELSDYLPKSQPVSYASVNNLTELEARVKVLEELVKKLQVQVDVATFF